MTGAAVRVLSVDGDLVLARAPALKDQLVEALADPAPLTLELAGVTRIDTAGVQLLLLAQRLAVTRGVALSLPSPSPVVTEALHALSLDTYMNMPSESGV
jgi:anti-sigma B factor antagonist